MAVLHQANLDELARHKRLRPALERRIAEQAREAAALEHRLQQLSEIPANAGPQDTLAIIFDMIAQTNAAGTKLKGALDTLSGYAKDCKAHYEDYAQDRIETVVRIQDQIAKEEALHYELLTMCAAHTSQHVESAAKAASLELAEAELRHATLKTELQQKTAEAAEMQQMIMTQVVHGPAGGR